MIIGDALDNILALEANLPTITDEESRRQRRRAAREREAEKLMIDGSGGPLAKKKPLGLEPGTKKKGINIFGRDVPTKTVVFAGLGLGAAVYLWSVAR